MTRLFLLAGSALALVAPVAAQTNVRLAEAQRAAWGRPGSTTYRLDNENVRFSGGRLLQTRFGPVLVAEGKVGTFSHVSPGRVGAFYLTRTPRGLARGRAFEGAVTGGSMGGIGEWSVSTAFAANPVIYAEGGSTGQGITCSFTTLTELTPAGPVEMARFQSYFGDMNASRRETTGKIANIARDRSFDVIYTGARPGRVRFVRQGGKYRPQGRVPLAGC